MALATTTAVAVVGVEGRLVRVEAHLGPGLPGCALVGLPDTAVSEARDRMRAAVLSTGEAWPARRLTIGLSPASLPKRGSAFDLAMVVAVLGAAGAVPSGALERRAFVGELGLDGSVRAVRGTLPAALAVASEDLDALVVPAANAGEATLVPGLPIIAVRSLGDLLAILRGAVPPPRAPVRSPAPAAPPCPDLADVAGQPTARRAVEVAAAGAHHLFLTGPPGTGKTMLAVGLAVAACQAGYSIYFTTLDDLVRRLRAAEATGRFHRQLQAYLRPALLVVDLPTPRLCRAATGNRWRGSGMTSWVVSSGAAVVSA